MRLCRLEEGDGFSLVDFAGLRAPRYAILSHTWGAEDEEVSYKDLIEGTGKSKSGYNKLRFCRKQAAKDHLDHFWVDTCCIDKSSSAELSEAINSMFRWYHEAAKCYVYLSDVSTAGSVRNTNDPSFQQSWKASFQHSRWFTRGWTLQELLAPICVEFFSAEGERLSDKHSMVREIQQITGINIQALQGVPLSQFSFDERISWAKRRETKREEDAAYSLLGLFDVYMPLIYGEGRERAFMRLRREIKESQTGALSQFNDAVVDLKEREEFLEALQFRVMDARFLSINDAYGNTCNWILTNREYLNWLKSDNELQHRCLWVKGKPGTGKSTLMKFLYAEAERTRKDTIILSFFFNARGEWLEKSVVGMYRSLLSQLFEQIPELQSAIDKYRDLLRVYETYSVNVDFHKRLLKATLKQQGHHKIMCFIDALDECDEDEVRDMILFFDQLFPFQARFQVCFSSRHYPSITIDHSIELVLEEQTGHDDDLATYVHNKLNIGQGKHTQSIRAEILQKASGIFVWVVLVVQILNKEFDRGRLHALRKRLKEIPKDIFELFQDIIMKDTENQEEMLLCIQWILFARRPLRPEELYFAILSGIDADEATQPWDREDFSLETIGRFVVNSSKGLAEFTKSSTPTAQFIHESVRDFLLKGAGIKKIWPELGENFSGKSHEHLRDCCLVLLEMELWNRIPKPFLNHRDSIVRAFPFLEYSVDNVLYHADSSERFRLSQQQFLDTFPLRQWIIIHNALEGIPARQYRNVSLLYILAEQNSPYLISNYPKKKSEANTTGGRYGLPILAALVNSHYEAVRALLGFDLDPETHASPTYITYPEYLCYVADWTMAHYAAKYGDLWLLGLLLRMEGHSIDQPDKNGRTPLSHAAASGHMKMTKALVSAHADVNSKARRGRTPLSFAISNAHYQVAAYLLYAGADINNRDGQILFDWAVYQGDVKLVQRLAGSCVKVGMPTLFLAVWHEHREVVRLLLKEYAHTQDDLDKCEQDLLSFAVTTGKTAVVEGVLSCKVKPDSTTMAALRQLNTPLHKVMRM